MTTILNALLVSLKESFKKQPNILIILLLFSTFFTEKSRLIFNTVISLLSQAFPDLVTYLRLFSSSKDIFVIWQALLLLFFLCLVWEILEKTLDGYHAIQINYPEKILFSTNSVLFIVLLICNKLSYIPLISWLSLERDSITDSFTHLLYYFLLALSFSVFLVLFSLVYLRPIWQIGKWIFDSTLSPLSKPLVFFTYLLILQKLANKILL